MRGGLPKAVSSEIVSRPDGTALVSLSQGLWAVIDEADAIFVGQHLWCALASRNTFYALAWVGGRHVRLHRALLRAKRGEIVDHISRDGLDNRRANLRLCTHSQNAVNKTVAVGPSGFRGVYHNGRKWSVRLRLHGQNINGGTFACPVDAAKERDRLAARLFGSFAVLNFPEGA